MLDDQVKGSPAISALTLLLLVLVLLLLLLLHMLDIICMLLTASCACHEAVTSSQCKLALGKLQPPQSSYRMQNRECEGQTIARVSRAAQTIIC